MNEVESRPLRYFVAVAEELNFARAAERLAIASPALSRAIAQLEARLGVRLFERSTRRVELTAAGAGLLEEVRGPLAAMDAAVRRARRASGPRRRLALAVKADLDGGILQPALDAYRDTVPIEVSFCAWGEQEAMLRDGRADVALLFAPLEDPELDAEELVTEPRVAVLAAHHPLATRVSLRPADLERDHDVAASGQLWWTRDAPVPAIQDFSQMLRLVELCRLVAFLPASVAARYPRPELATVPLADVPPATLMVAWPRSSRSLAVAAFVRAACDVAAEVYRG